jgi:hypothetical protein
MSKRVISGISVGAPAAAIMFVTSLVGTSLVGTSLLGTSLLGQPARAAEDCLTAPNRAPAPGGHWYYHLDRASDRKCWYLVEPPPQAPSAQAPSLQMPIAQAPSTQAPQPQFAPEPTPPPAQPGFGSFFSSLGLAPPPQPNTTGDPRIAQPAPAGDPRIGDAEPGRQPRMTLASKQHRTVHLPPPAAEHSEERPAASLNQAERDALFEEFLKWRERQ